MSPQDGALVLVVDDERNLRRAVTAGLAANGYRTATATTGKEALDQAATACPSVIVLDLALPDVDGVEVCQRIRRWSQVPIIVLTAESANERKVQALDLGADDYMTKPFDMSELLARIRVALRHRDLRTGIEEESVLRVGDMVVDLSGRTVSVGGRSVDLTPREFALLTFLARHPGRVLTHGAILQEVWGPAHIADTQYLRVYVGQIRKKIEDTDEHRRLVTAPGVGYRLVALA